MAKDENRKRINFILDLNKPREKALADFLESQFSISGTVKEALEDKMLRDSGKLIDVISNIDVKEESVPALSGIDGMINI